jgi:hypothetical protein
MCFDFLCNLSETFLIIRRNKRDIIINVHRYSCKISATLVGFHLNLNFLDRFSKNNQIPNFMEICQVEAELFHEDRQRDTLTKLIDAFRKFAKRPKN